MVVRVLLLEFLIELSILKKASFESRLLHQTEKIDMTSKVCDWIRT